MSDDKLQDSNGDAIEEAAKTGGPSAAGGTGLDDIDDSDLM